jgi:hypothetical protein
VSWRGALLALLGLVSFGVGVSWGCYATTGPTPTCSADPTQPWCPQPIHDERADAGR